LRVRGDTKIGELVRIVMIVIRIIDDCNGSNNNNNDDDDDDDDDDDVRDKEIMIPVII